MPDLAAQPLPFVIDSRSSLCFVDREDVSWSVFDCMKISGRLVVVGTGSRAAQYRLFAPINGAAPRVYLFFAAESRETHPLKLERQLAQASAILADREP